jgi:hypothetical protein
LLLLAAIRFVLLGRLGRTVEKIASAASPSNVGPGVLPGARNLDIAVGTAECIVPSLTRDRAGLMRLRPGCLQLFGGRPTPLLRSRRSDGELGE